MIRTSDEDWSIISSSSEIDDERSNLSVLGDEQSETTPSGDLDHEIDPQVNSRDTSTESQLESTNEFQTTESIDTSITNDASVQTLKLPQNVNSRRNSTLKNEDRPVQRIIDFYEHLADNTVKLHETIKFQSDRLYHQYATKPDENDETLTTESLFPIKSVTCQKVSKCLEANSEYLIYHLVLILALFLGTAFGSVKVFKYMSYKEPETFYSSVSNMWDSLVYTSVPRSAWSLPFSQKPKKLRAVLYWNELSGSDTVFLIKNSIKGAYLKVSHFPFTDKLTKGMAELRALLSMENFNSVVDSTLKVSGDSLSYVVDSWRRTFDTSSSFVVDGFQTCKPFLNNIKMQGITWTCRLIESAQSGTNFVLNGISTIFNVSVEQATELYDEFQTGYFNRKV